MNYDLSEQMKTINLPKKSSQHKIQACLGIFIIDLKSIFQMLLPTVVHLFKLFKVFFKIYFIDYAITVVPFSLLYSPLLCTPPPTHIPPFSSHPWVVHVSSLAPTLYYSYTILNVPYFLPTIYATILCTFSPSSTHLLPH